MVVSRERPGVSTLRLIGKTTRICSYHLLFTIGGIFGVRVGALSSGDATADGKQF